MEKKPYQNLNDEDLIKKRNLIKGATIGLGIVDIAVFVILIYLFLKVGSEERNFATLIPLFILPITFIPLLINLNLINKEVK